jgi:hypothetical protein
MREVEETFNNRNTGHSTRGLFDKKALATPALFFACSLPFMHQKRL